MNTQDSTANSKTDTNRMVHVVDDDDAMRDALSVLLRVRGYQVATYPSATIFLAARPPSDGCCLITDVQMPEMNGMEMLQALQQRSDSYPTIVLCGRPTPTLEANARALGVRAFLAKPFEPNALDDILSGMFAQAA